MSELLVSDKSIPSYRRVTLNNPPINAITDRMYDAFYDLVTEIEADDSIKVVTFESANPDFSSPTIAVLSPAAGLALHPGSMRPRAWPTAVS